MTTDSTGGKSLADRQMWRKQAGAEERWGPYVCSMTECASAAYLRLMEVVKSKVKQCQTSDTPAKVTQIPAQLDLRAAEDVLHAQQLAKWALSL